ncbi:MAG: hypothetical protein MOGMAGMI_00191 [Candidatus Omnitrophica bacterium]|nr:hypothetical protein [Candidatus Omnitrophota bacterium]
MRRSLHPRLTGLIVSAAFLLTAHPSITHAAQDYHEYKQEKGDLKLTGRIYHTGDGRVAVEAWPGPRKRSPKVDQIILKSPSGELYRATLNERVPLSKIPAKRKDYLAWLESLIVDTAYAACSVHGESCPSECGGGSGSSGDDKGSSGEAYAGLGLLAGIASNTEKEWVSTSQFTVKEEPGTWRAEIVVVDDKGMKQSFVVPFELDKISTPRQVAVEKVKELRAADVASISSVDPDGNTTTVTLNPDGSRVVIVTDRAGRITSRKTFPPRRGASRTFIDPKTGLRITETHNPDGSVTRHAEDKDGNWSEGHYYPGGKKPDPVPAASPEPEQPASTPEPEPSPTPESSPTPEPSPTPEATPEPTPYPPYIPSDPWKWPGIEWKPGGLVTSTPEEPVHSTPRTEPEPSRIGILLERTDNRWIPTHGGKTSVIARLYQPVGGTNNYWWVPTQQKRVITLKFVQRSSEPGQSVNKKLDHADQGTPDIYLKQEDNPGTVCSEDGGGMGYHFGRSETMGEFNEFTFVVRSEDYGSYSTLEASCRDCVPLMKHRNGLVFETERPEEYQVRVPKDDNDNQISDGWLWDRAKSPAADEDDDNIPNGNGVNGDGYSAYEEYRGFFAKGTHHRTSLDTKTLFIRNRHGLDTTKFVASKLEYYEIDHPEWDTDKVVNYSYNHAHVVDQHGLLLVNKDLGEGLLGLMSPEWSGMPQMLVGAMGPPKHVFQVQVNVARHGDLSVGYIYDDYQATVAHELGHAIGMPHHGNPLWSTWKKEVRQATGGASDWLPGKVISSPTLCSRKLPREYIFGKKHNQSSGTLECIMRYPYMAEVYEQSDGTLDCATPEPGQTIFCETSSGNGWNAGNRCAGDAANGNCMSYLQVNDR